MAASSPDGLDKVVVIDVISTRKKAEGPARDLYFWASDLFVVSEVRRRGPHMIISEYKQRL